MEQDMAEDYICQVEEIVQLLATEQHQPHEYLYGSKRQQLRLTVLETVLYRKNSINLQSRRRPEKHFLCVFFFLSWLTLPSYFILPTFSQISLLKGGPKLGCWEPRGMQERTEHIALALVAFLKYWKKRSF